MVTKRKPCPDGQKRCARCHRCRPLDQFSPGNKRDRQCQAEYQKAYYETHPDKYMEHLRRNRDRRREQKVNRSDKNAASG